MAPPPLPLPLLHANPFSLHLLQPQMHDSIFSFPFFLLFASLSLLSLTLFSVSLYKRLSHTKGHRNPETQKPAMVGENRATHLESSVLLASESDSEKLLDDPNSGAGGKKKRRKAKKKKINSGTEEKGANAGVRIESYPFTSSSSAMQRRIKLQYDELVKSNHSNKLTLQQVVQFATSLVDARNELQHKADVIQRKFVITKALLCKADRSTFDRLRQQIYKLELEQKRLEEDAFVYNSLQQQLKLLPVYQKMLEVGACIEKEKSCEVRENRDDEFADISFEELLAQEKKDSFWQKNGKSRLCSS